MLTRTSPGNFDGPASDAVRIVHKSSKAGTNQAAFRYAKKAVPAQEFSTGQGPLPGCEFTPEEGGRVFRAACVFDPAAPPGARYSFSELLDDGTLNPLESKDNDGDPVLMLVINGVAAPPRALRAAPARKKPAAKKRPKKGK